MSTESSPHWREAAIVLGAIVMFVVGIGVDRMWNSESGMDALRQFQQQAVANGFAHWAHPATTWNPEYGFMRNAVPTPSPTSAGKE